MRFLDDPGVEGDVAAVGGQPDRAQIDALHAGAGLGEDRAKAQEDLGQADQIRVAATAQAGHGSAGEDRVREGERVVATVRVGVPAKVPEGKVRCAAAEHTTWVD